MAAVIQSSSLPKAPPPSLVSRTMFVPPRFALSTAANSVASYAASNINDAKDLQSGFGMGV